MNLWDLVSSRFAGNVLIIFCCTVCGLIMMDRSVPNQLRAVCLILQPIISAQAIVAVEYNNRMRDLEDLTAARTKQVMWDLTVIKQRTDTLIHNLVVSEKHCRDLSYELNAGVGLDGRVKALTEEVRRWAPSEAVSTWLHTIRAFFSCATETKKGT